MNESGRGKKFMGFRCGVGRKGYMERILIRMFCKCDSVGKTDIQRAQ